MSLLHDSPDTATADGQPVRFRAATLEQALSQARSKLGPDVEVLDANRIRRGGVGGFFATDLGVEVAIRPANDDDRSSAHHRPHDPMPLAHGRGGGPEDRSDDFDARLAHLDRAIYGTGASTGIDRLLDRANEADGFGGNANAPTTSFAEHLARELAGSRSLPRQSERVDQGRPAGDVGTTSTRADGRPGELGSPHADSAAEARTPVARPCTESDERPTPSVAPPPTDAPLREVRPNPFDLGRHADVAAGAVGRLISELADISPHPGSRVHQLSRLTVSLTAADGSSVEFSAELSGVHDG